MDVFKKVIGVIILFLAGIFSLGTFLNFIRQIQKLINKEEEYTSYNIGYIAGIFVGLIIISIFIFYMWKFGFKLIRKRKEEINSVNDIGNIE